ncbi:MAG: Zn-ribbon domain-containing OB-fold protein [Candidatus Binatia bacterium]|mgnify:CR=1 FL=1|jgi:hypothetical protein|nr:Zn-ribbon domain-containing OB-fold protein [Candidatus Binatia bacterium]
MAEKSLPKVNSIDRDFWQGAAQGKLLLQKCKKCSHLQFFPRATCTDCFSMDLDWVQASGRGTVHSFSLVQVPRNPAFKEDVPITYADIILEEGVLMQSRILGKDKEKVKIGSPVKVFFQETQDLDIKLPVFELTN